MSWNFRAALSGLGMCGLILILPGPALAGKKPTLTLGAPHKGSAVKVVLEAERLQYRPGLGRILLSGKVSLRVGILKLKARSVTVLLDRKGRPTRVDARGAVQLTHGQSVGSAGSATLNLGIKKRWIALEGSPRLRWAPLGLTLEAHRIEVDLTTGRLNVQRAKACLNRTGELARKSQKPARPATRGK